MLSLSGEDEVHRDLSLRASRNIESYEKRRVWGTLACVVLCGAVASTGCGSVPVTDGFRSQLPQQSEKIIVWGHHPSAVDTATIWLQRRGLSALDQAGLQQALGEHRPRAVRWEAAAEEEAVILKAATDLGVDQVVFVQDFGDLRAPMVSIRGVQAPTRRVLWGGTARFADYGSKPPTDALADLTCQALATAWGLREPGEKRFKSSQAMCTAP